MTWSLTLETRRWLLREPFVLARSVETEIPTVVVTITDDAGRRGRGEGCGVSYRGETPETMSVQIEEVRRQIEGEINRDALLTLLPAGGARAAIDAALWDLEARQTGRSAFDLAEVGAPHPVTTAYSIGIRSLAAYQATAEARSRYAALKVKVGKDDPVAAIEAVRRGSPRAQIIVDANQAWSVADLRRVAPALADLGVTLLEQPIAVGAEGDLDGYACPIPLCADELIEDTHDLDKVVGRFDFVNIKLDKTGGLTEGLRLAAAARRAGLGLMVGCMAGSSLSMAPAFVLAQICAFVDLDGPLLQVDDWPDGITYNDGVMSVPGPTLWGNAMAKVLERP